MVSTAIKAVEFVSDWPLSSTKPQLYLADDGYRYVVKRYTGDRTTANEAIVSALADAVGAPVPPWTLIDVDGETAFGSRYVETVVRPVCNAENIQRWHRLQHLYYLTAKFDVQRIYDSAGMMLAIDFGHFLTGPNWTRETLEACEILSVDVRDCRKLQVELSREAIAFAAAAPDESWGLTVDDRAAGAEFIWKRQDHLC